MHPVFGDLMRACYYRTCIYIYGKGSITTRSTHRLVTPPMIGNWPLISTFHTPLFSFILGITSPKGSWHHIRLFRKRKDGKTITWVENHEGSVCRKQFSMFLWFRVSTSRHLPFKTAREADGSARHFSSFAPISVTHLMLQLRTAGPGKRGILRVLLILPTTRTEANAKVKNAQLTMLIWSGIAMLPHRYLSPLREWQAKLVFDLQVNDQYVRYSLVVVMSSVDFTSARVITLFYYYSKKQKLSDDKSR